jgi:hypothetical protein
VKKEVEIGLKMVNPKLSRVNFDKYSKNITGVAEFLIKIKGGRKKKFINMSVDYFNSLLNYYQKTLKLKGFRIMHINTQLAKDLYKEFLEERGSLYWEDGMGNTSITTDGGRIHQKIDAENINLDKIKEGLRDKFEKRIGYA